MRFEELELYDFLSFEKLVYNFERRPLLIQGLNLTDNRQKTNGTGKSSIQSAIEYCCNGTTSRNVRDKDLVRYTKEQACIKLKISCDVRKEYLYINWIIKLKGSNSLRLFIEKYNEGEKEKVSFSTVADGKKYIDSWIGISKDDLFNYFLINKSRFKSFFKSSNKDKVDLINRFSDASIIDGLENIDSSDIRSKYDETFNKMNKITGSIETRESDLEEELKRDLKEEKNEKIEILKSKKEKFLKSIKNKKESIKDFEKDKEAYEKDNESTLKIIKSFDSELKSATRDVESFVKTDWKKKRNIINDIIDVKNNFNNNINDTIDKRKEQINKVNNKLSKLNTSLAGAITCPSCSHEFVPNSDIDLIKAKKTAQQLASFKPSLEEDVEKEKEKLKEAKIALSKLNDQLDKLREKEEDELDTLDELKETLDEIISRVDKLNEKIEDNDDEIKDIDSEIDDEKDSIKTIKLSIKETDIEIKELSSSTNDNKDKIKSIKSDIKEFKINHSLLEKDYTKLGDELYEINQWKNNFKQFKTYLANQSLELIQYHMNSYLKDIGSDIRIRLDGFKQLANGSFKDEITTTVIRNGIERPFESYSGGEYGRLLFISILANRHMINSNHKYGGLDYLSIDEVFEGVDSFGLKDIVDVAKKLEITVQIVTHVSDEDFGSEDAITVIREKGLSRIEPGSVRI